MTAAQVFVLDPGLRWLGIAAVASLLFALFTLATARRDRNRHNQERTR